ncbi:MAG: DUF4136 domain-containing protein [Acidobacteriaceae bacterium]
MMKVCRLMAVAACSTIFLLPMASAADIKVDYNHHLNFSQYKTYSWGKVSVSDSLVAERIHRVVNEDLQKAGWTEVPTGGQVTIMAHDNIHNEQEEETYYDGMGGGWGDGWGWGGWGMGGGLMGMGGMGMGGMSTTSVENYRTAHLVIDMFNTQSKALLWRGVSRGELSNKPAANRKNLYEDIDKMFKHFPPQPKH